MSKTLIQRELNSFINLFYREEKWNKIFFRNIVQARLALYDNLNPTNFALCKYKANFFNETKFKSILHLIYTNVIFIVGFQADKDVSIDIRLNDRYSVKQDIKGGDKFYFSKFNIIPVTMLADVEITWETKQDISLILCICSKPLSTYLRNNKFSTSLFFNDELVHMVYEDGRATLSKTISNDIVSIPFVVNEEYKQMLARETSNKVLNELLEVVMRPGNFNSFMSLDELERMKEYNTNL